MSLPKFIQNDGEMNKGGESLEGSNLENLYFLVETGLLRVKHH